MLLDQYAAEPIAQGLTHRGIHVIRKPWANQLKADAVTVLRQVLFAGRLTIPRHPQLVTELSSLEQTVLSSGRVRFAAPPGQHDDYATALLAMVHELGTRQGWANGSADVAAVA